MTKAGVPSAIALLIHSVGFFVYLLLLYSGILSPTYLKASVYVLMACILLFLVIDEWNGVQDHKQWQFNTVNKITFVFNFVCAAFTILNICDAVILMILYALAILLATFTILHAGLKHGYFND
jgi:hypothetical protein